MSFRLPSYWARLGKLEKCFLLIALLYLALVALAPENGFTSLLGVAFFALSAWVLLRLSRWGLRKAIWRLRNRLIVTYVLIAVVPILLILTLAGLGAYMLASQIAVYLARSELDRRVASLQAASAALQHLASEPRAEAQRDLQILSELNPASAFLLVSQGAALRWPESADLVPSAARSDSGGVALLDGRYYAWSCRTQSQAQLIAATPLTSQYLSGMTPGLGEVSLLPLRTAGGKLQLASSAAPETGAQLPPPANPLDLDVNWVMLVPVINWVNGERDSTALLLVHTRLSAIVSLIVSRKVDELQGVLPILLLAATIAFLVVEIVSLATGISLTRSITGAVHSLYEGTQRVTQGDFSHMIQVSGRDQLAELSQSFNAMTGNLARLLEVAKEKERLQGEMEIARQVQEQLYPKTPPVLRSIRVMGMCQPARMCSGDYYDYQLLAGGRLALALGDVAGKGISAALLMATIRAALRMELRASTGLAAASDQPVNGLPLSTARMVSDLNQQLHASTSPEKYASFWFALYDDVAGTITYTNAGHLPPLLIHNGAASRLDISGTVVGAFPFAQYGESRLELQCGDLLVCYTDGITEPENEYGEMFGEERLIELLTKSADQDEGQIMETVLESLEQWTGTPELSDDRTVMMVRKL